MRTFILGAGADTVVFAATNNGVDTITNFTAGDKLNFKDFSNNTLTAGIVNIASAAQQALNSTYANKIYQTTINGNIASRDYGGTDFDLLFNDSGKPFTKAITSGSKDLIVVKGNDVTQIYYVSDNNNTVEASDVDLVAVISNNGTGVTLADANLVLA